MDIEISKRWSGWIYQQWSAFFAPSRMNWFDFTLIGAGWEYSPYKESCEVQVALLGFSAGLSFFYGRFRSDPQHPATPSD